MSVVDESIKKECLVVVGVFGVVMVGEGVGVGHGYVGEAKGAELLCACVCV
eukprot:SAG25_NODE_14361_length_256_cov_0.515924_1_plen_51_part_00